MKKILVTLVSILIVNPSKSVLNVCFSLSKLHKKVAFLQLQRALLHLEQDISLFSLQGKASLIKKKYEQYIYSNQASKASLRSQHSWEKNTVFVTKTISFCFFQPIGLYNGKYEWAARPGTGDCSLNLMAIDIKFDDGLWECQVTASSFESQDALASKPARLVVRGNIQIQLESNFLIALDTLLEFP